MTSSIGLSSTESLVIKKLGTSFSIIISFFIYPTKEKINISPTAPVISNSPLPFVTIPLLVPFISTLTLAKGRSSVVVTLPFINFVTVPCCELPVSVISLDSTSTSSLATISAGKGFFDLSVSGSMRNVFVFIFLNLRSVSFNKTSSICSTGCLLSITGSTIISPNDLSEKRK